MLKLNLIRINLAPIKFIECIKGFYSYDPDKFLKTEIFFSILDHHADSFVLFESRF